jgi:predicted hydrocarbon binding protein
MFQKFSLWSISFFYFMQKCAEPLEDYSSFSKLPEPLLALVLLTYTENLLKCHIQFDVLLFHNRTNSNCLINWSQKMSTLVTSVIPQVRSELGDFNSIVCFKAVVVGIEEALGEKAAAIAMIAAGRTRGKKLATDLGLTGKAHSLEEVAQLLRAALGEEGTRLCIVDKVVEENGNYQVYCRETVCSAGEPQGSPRQLTFTLGAIQGALEQAIGKRLRGKQVESVLRGGSHDVIEFEVLS